MGAAVRRTSPVRVERRATATGRRRALRGPVVDGPRRRRPLVGRVRELPRGRGRRPAHRRPRMLGVGVHPRRARPVRGARRSTSRPLRIGVLVQPFLTFDAGGTARVRRRRRDRVAVAPGGPHGRGRRPPAAAVTSGGGRRDDRREPELGAAPGDVVAAAGLARRAAASIGAAAIEWGAVGGEIFLLQVGPDVTAEAPVRRAATACRAADADPGRRRAPRPARDARSRDRSQTSWCSRGRSALASVRGGGARSWSTTGAGAIAEARALAAELVAAVWGPPPDAARERRRTCPCSAAGAETDGVSRRSRARDRRSGGARRIVGLDRRDRGEPSRPRASSRAAAGVAADVGRARSARSRARRRCTQPVPGGGSRSSPRSSRARGHAGPGRRSSTASAPAACTASATALDRPPRSPRGPRGTGSRCPSSHRCSGTAPLSSPPAGRRARTCSRSRARSGCRP